MDYEELYNPEKFLLLKEQHELLRECLSCIDWQSSRLIELYFGFNGPPKTIRQLSLNRNATDKDIEDRLTYALCQLQRIMDNREWIADSFIIYTGLAVFNNLGT